MREKSEELRRRISNGNVEIGERPIAVRERVLSVGPISVSVASIITDGSRDAISRSRSNSEIDRDGEKQNETNLSHQSSVVVVSNRRRRRRSARPAPGRAVGVHRALLPLAGRHGCKCERLTTRVRQVWRMERVNKRESRARYEKKMRGKSEPELVTRSS